MKYTAIFIDPDNKAVYSVKFFIANPSKDMAWREIQAQTPAGKRLLFILPGEQLVYNPNNISLTEVA